MRTEEVERRLAQLGRRLRALRLERGMSLLDVERISDGELKGVVVGSYERGDRNVSITRLCEIAEFYGVEIADLVAEAANGQTPARSLDSALHQTGIDARVTDWHHPSSATRGVMVRLAHSDVPRLAEALASAGAATADRLSADESAPH
jgi:transcriptional regulator with XRE-family HTH domain